MRDDVLAIAVTCNRYVPFPAPPYPPPPMHAFARHASPHGPRLCAWLAQPALVATHHDAWPPCSDTPNEGRVVRPSSANGVLPARFAREPTTWGGALSALNLNPSRFWLLAFHRAFLATHKGPANSGGEPSRFPNLPTIAPWPLVTTTHYDSHGSLPPPWKASPIPSRSGMSAPPRTPSRNHRHRHLCLYPPVQDQTSPAQLSSLSPASAQLRRVECFATATHDDAQPTPCP